MGIIELKIKIIIVLLISIFLLVPGILAVTKEECELGDGEWVVNQLAYTDEPISSRKELQPICKCDTGFYWNEASNSCEDDSEVRCIQTQGKWINGSCQCSEGTIKWTPGFGCDMPGPEPKASEDNELSANSGMVSKSEERNVSYEILLFTAIFILLLIIGIILYSYFRKKRRSERKEDEDQ